jgi:tetratricopeptide (TPR) repeat protein
MQSYVAKLLNLQKKNTHYAPFVLGVFLLVSCSSPSVKKHSSFDGSAGEVTRRTQAAWEQQDHTASAEFHFALAHAYSMEGKVENAIEEYRAALIYDPGSAMLYSKLASEYLRKGSSSLAIEACKKAIELDPKSIDAHLMLGGIHAVNNDHDQAIREYEEVLKLEPGNDEAAVFKTQVLVEKGMVDEALVFIRKFVSKTNDSAAAWFYVGKLEHLKNETNASIAAFRKALSVRPGFVQASLALGMILESVNQVEKAREVYREQLENRQDLTIAGRLVAIHLKKSEFDPALKVLETMTELDPEDLNIRMKVGLIRMQKKDWLGARDAFLEITRKVPDSDKANYYLSAAFEELGLKENAIAHLFKIAPDSRLFEEANIHAAMLLKKDGMNDRAMEAISAAIVKAPETSGFYVVKASFHEDVKELKKAENTLFDGLKYFPENEKLIYFYGAILDKQAKQDEAMEQMLKLLKINPEHADALNYVAYTWTMQGVRLNDAEEMLKRALKIKPENPFILDSMGWNQFRLGKQAAALKYLEKAISYKSDEQAILEHLVEVYSSNQMPERAQATRMKLQKLNPDFKDSSNRAPASVKP